MRLARKLIFALVVGIFAVMAFNAYSRLRSEVVLFEADAVRDLRAMARAVSAGTETIWRRIGQERARQFVRDVNLARDDIEVRWVWLDELAAGEKPPQVSPRRRARLAEGRELTFVDDGEDGDDGGRRYLYWPLAIDSTRPAALEVSATLDAQREFIAGSRRIVALTTLAIVAVCGLIAAGVGFWFVGRPMRLLSEKARRVGEGDLSGPLVLRQRDEIGELADEINAMCERLADANRTAASETRARIAALEQLRHADRLRTVGQLASGVAHELGTPLNVVAGHAKMLRRGELSPSETRTSLDVIVEQVDRMTAIIRQLLDFSRRRGPTLATTDLHAAAARTVEMLTPLADKKDVVLEMNPNGRATHVRADHGQIQQALTNLVVNAIQASPGGGHVRITVDRRLAQPPEDGDGSEVECACVAVADDGPGIPPENVPHVFEPFFTTKDVGEGTGLGLAVAYGIVREHEGWIDVASRPGEGSQFSMYLRIAGRGTAEPVKPATR